MSPGCFAQRRRHRKPVATLQVKGAAFVAARPSADDVFPVRRMQNDLGDTTALWLRPPGPSGGKEGQLGLDRLLDLLCLFLLKDTSVVQDNTL
jgi:hypothetical protein